MCCGLLLKEDCNTILGDVLCRLRDNYVGITLLKLNRHTNSWNNVAAISYLEAGTEC